MCLVIKGTRLNLQSNIMTVQSIVNLPIVGQRVILKKSSLEDAQYLSDCYNQVEFRRLFRLSNTQPVSVGAFEKDLARGNVPLNMLRKVEWVICKKNNNNSDSRPIGLASLVDINQVHKTAEFQIGITNSDDRLLGVATEASFLAMEFAFRVLSLFKLHSFVYGFNQYSQKSTISLGFTQEGILREQYWDPYEQKHIDLFVNGLLAREFWKHKRIAKLSSRLLRRDITLRKPLPEVSNIRISSHSKKELSDMKALLKESHAHYSANT